MSLRWLALAACLGVASCATLSEEQCLDANWYEIGQRDGSLGRPSDFVEQHREACADVGVVPDVARWTQGRAVGLRSYCTPENAYWLGRQGRLVAPVCSTNLDELDAANRQGRRFFEIRLDINELERRLYDINSEIARLSPSDAGAFARLSAEQSRIYLRLNMLRARQLVYARWP